MVVTVATSVAELGRLLADVLSQDGHAVEVVDSGRAAVSTFLSAPPDVAVLDVRLGDVTGMDVVRALRRCEGGGDVTVVLLADDPGPVRAIGAGLGVRHVLGKPPSLLDLRDVVAGAPVRPRAISVEGRARPVVAVHRPAPTFTEPVTPAAPTPEVVHALMRLRKELPRLEGADAWTVLGLPANASAELVRRAGDRLRARYGDLARTNGGELRELAEQMLRRVDAAVADAGIAAPPAEADGAGVAEGRALLAKADWRAADRHFGALRDARPDSAVALACLGWARFHNPALPKAVREPDGAALVELATTFDPWLADAWYYRAAIARAQGNIPAARALAERAVRVEPDHVGALRLLLELPPA